MKKILFIIGAIILFPIVVCAVTVTYPINGGTGLSQPAIGLMYSEGGNNPMVSTTSPTVGYLTATSTTATSSLYGNLAVGMGTTYNYSPPATGMMTQVDNPSAGCPAIGGEYVFGIFSYLVYNGTTYYSTSSLVFDKTDNNDGQNFEWSLSWAPVPGVSGYVLQEFTDPCNNNDGTADLGNVTSVTVDTANDIPEVNFDPVPLLPTFPFTIYPNNLIASTTSHFNGDVFTNENGDDTITQSFGTTSTEYGYQWVYDNKKLQPYLGFDPHGSYIIDTNVPVGGLVLQNTDPNYVQNGPVYSAVGFCEDAGFACLSDFGPNQVVIGPGDYGYASTTLFIGNGPTNGFGLEKNSALTMDLNTGMVGLGLGYINNDYPPDQAFPGKYFFDINSNTLYCNGQQARNSGQGCIPDYLLKQTPIDIGDSQNNSWAIAWTGSSTFATLNVASTTASHISYASTTAISAQTASTTNQYISALGTPAGTFLAVDSTGKVIATTSPTGSNFFINSGASTYLSTGSNLGIGSTSPWANLSIARSVYSGTTPFMSISSSTPGAGGSSIGTTTAFQIGANGDTSMGTSTPSSLIPGNTNQLSVVDSNNAPNIAQFYNASGTAEETFSKTGTVTANFFAGSNATIGGNNGLFFDGTTGDGQITALTTTNIIMNWGFPNTSAPYSFNSNGTTLLQGSALALGIGTTSPWAYLSVGVPVYSTTKPMFAIGSSTASGTTTPLIVNNNGNVGIGTTSPWRTLAISGTIGFTGLDSSTGKNSLCIDGTTGDVVTAGGNTCTLSSKYVKHDVEDMTEAEAAHDVVALRSITYTSNDDNSLNVGFIAEEVQNIDPRLVDHASATTTVDGHTFLPGDPIAVNYGNISSVIIKYLQDEKGAAPTGRGSADWQWFAIGLLGIGLIYQQVKSKKP